MSSQTKQPQILIIDDDDDVIQESSVGSTSTSSLASSSTSVSASCSTDPSLVKELVCDFFESQFSLKGESCELGSQLPQNDCRRPSREFQEVASALRELGQRYVQLYEDRIKIIIDDFQKKVEIENVAQSFEYLSQEFFVEGINWHYILTYFVFSAEIAQYANQCGLASVDDVADWLIKFIDVHLSKWIRQNGGWIGFRKFFVEKGFLTSEGKTSSNSADKDEKNSKAMLLGTAAAALSLGCYLKSFWNRP